jgi:hypothetical protein
MTTINSIISDSIYQQYDFIYRSSLPSSLNTINFVSNFDDWLERLEGLEGLERLERGEVPASR